ncbi:hypothetical protein GCM10027168_12480 [Streptomyces capparidis]
MVACATATAVMAFSAPASAATTLSCHANGPADTGRGCDMTTEAYGSCTYYASGGVKGGHRAYAGGFDASERDLRVNGSSWNCTTADPIKVTTGCGDTVPGDWTFKDVRDVKVYSCRINSASAVSSCAKATFY